MQRFIVVNKTAKDNRALLRELAEQSPDCAALQRRMEAAGRHEQHASTMTIQGAFESTRYLQQYQQLRKVVMGTATPTEAEALSLLQQMIWTMPRGIHGYTMEELLAISPVLVLLTQTEGQGDFYVLTQDNITNFVYQLGSDHWSSNIFPPLLEEQELGPLSSKIKYGVCRRDLPASEAQEAKWRKEEKKALGKGESWVRPVWHQPKPERKAGAPVFLHFNLKIKLATPHLKDEKGAQVAEEEVIIDVNDGSAEKTARWNLINDRNGREDQLTVSGNRALLRRAAQYIIWAMRNPQDLTEERTATAPKEPITFASLGLHQPDYMAGGEDLKGQDDENLARNAGGAKLSLESKKKLAEFLDTI